MKMHELLDSPKKWTKEEYARDEYGHPINAISPFATCYCILGAAQKCYPNPEEYSNVISLIETNLTEKSRGGHIPHFNDNKSTTWEDVYKLLKELDV